MIHTDATSLTTRAQPLESCRGVSGNGAYIKFLTLPGALWRFATAHRRRGRFVPEDSGGGRGDGYEPLQAQEQDS